MSLPWVILLWDAGLGPFNTFCSDVITATFDVPERPVDIRPDLGHVADVQLVMKESLGLSYVCLRLQQLSGRMLTEQACLLTTGRLLA